MGKAYGGGMKPMRLDNGVRLQNRAETRVFFTLIGVLAG